MTKPLTIGSTGAGDDTYQFPAIINAVLGTKFKIVTGYPGGNDVSLALERGEVQGRCGWSWSSIKTTRPDWIASKKIVVLVQMSLSKHPDLPDVPLIMDFAKTDEAAPDLQADLCAPGHGPAVSRAARRAGRSPRRVAPGVHGDDDGQGVSRRRRGEQIRNQSGRAANKWKRWSRKSTRRRRT